MPVKGYKVKDSILMDLEDEFKIKSELWNDIRILLTEKYDVPYMTIFDSEFTIDNIVETLEKIIKVSNEEENEILKN